MLNISFRKIVLFLFDLMALIISYGLVYIVLRATVVFDVGYLPYEIIGISVFIIPITLTRLFTGVYKNIWRYAEAREYLALILADVIGALISLGAGYVIFKDLFFEFFIAASAALSLICILLARVCYRQLGVYHNIREKENVDENLKYVAIFGAGSAGVALLNELRNDKNHNILPYCFFDIDKSKAGSTIRGIKVLYEGDDIVKVLKNSPVTDIIIAIPSLDADKQRLIIQKCAKTGCKVKLYEHVYDRIDGAEKSKGTIRDVNIEDLLFRGVVTFGQDNVKEMLKGKTIAVTGGGGSIGSELSRQIAAMEPKQLIIIDIYENNAYLIEQELIRKYGKKLNLKVEIASVRDKEKLVHLFNKYDVQYVFHAAAHKHVPLMETSVDEAVKNNIFGTKNVIDACEETGVLKMLLISTDKAVNPTSVMGATKRFCEMMVQSKTESTTEYVAVRFGNVLGSNGSVIPLFKKQIEAGGPVTVTSKKITRYFMTIPEAVSLVLQAFVMAVKSEIFVLDMGEPVKILDLAESMIRLSGLKPYQDIDIVEIGLRPGEKMYEELLIKKETLEKTHNDKIFVEREAGFTQQEIDGFIGTLREVVDTKDNKKIKETMQKIIPTFVPPSNPKKLKDTDDK